MHPLQILLTGPADSGKTFTLKMLMQSENRFSKKYDEKYNSYVTCASTGIAAANLNGTTLHSAFRISNSRLHCGLNVEALSTFRMAFKNVGLVILDKCSMIVAVMLSQLNSCLQQIMNDYDQPFGSINIVFCGDLRQLPPMCQTSIYKRSKTMFVASVCGRC
jgi:hypothetical protein